MTQQTSHTLLYVGTYTRTDSQGIYLFRMDNSSGTLEQVSTVADIANPSFLALHPDRTHLYTVAEIDDYLGQHSGAVSAYAIFLETGELTFLNRMPTGGRDPCHLSVDATGRYVLVANYQGGSICMLPIRPDGGLASASDFVQHEGSSVNTQRQSGPHAHSVNLDPANRFLLAPDLGMDKVMIYRLDLESGKLVANEPSHAPATPGAGPRHMAFSADGRFVYVINELGSTVSAFSYDADRGGLREVQSISTLPKGHSGDSTTADIHVHPNGEFLYGSNRGHDSIAIFRIDRTTGELSPLGHESTRGSTPRNFAIDPSGEFLLAANQNSDSIVTFRIDPRTGLLDATDQAATVPMPVCIKFLS